MITTDSSTVDQHRSTPVERAKRRFAARGNNPAILADVYRNAINIAIWQRRLSGELLHAVERLVKSNPALMASMTVSPRSALASISDALGSTQQCVVSRNIVELVEMFCTLFGLKRAGLRLGVLDSAMCPKFHVDRVPCRLVTTYLGGGTEWLLHESVDRSKLGTGSRGKSDFESGLIESPNDIQQLGSGDVALLKGELWEGNEDAGLVHRSPTVEAGDLRLLLTLDVSR